MNKNGQWLLLTSSGCHVNCQKKALKVLPASNWTSTFDYSPNLSFIQASYNKTNSLNGSQGLARLCAPTIAGRHRFPGSQQPSARLIVILVHADQQADALRAGGRPQGVRDEDPLEGLQQSPAQVVCPEGLEVVQLRELDVADDGAQVPGAQQRAGSAEQLELPLQRLTLVRGDSFT